MLAGYSAGQLFQPTPDGGTPDGGFCLEATMPSYVPTTGASV